MKVCIYLRKSRADTEAELRGEGETLARHERILLEVAKRQNLHIEKIYRELVSGETIAARPVMQLLLDEVEQGIWEGVLVVEIDRLARGNSIDQGIIAQTFKYSNTRIITPNKVYDPNNDNDEIFFEFSLFMSRQEYRSINRRLRQGVMSSVNEGKYLAGISPFGYTRKKLEKEKGMTLEINPEEAEKVKLIFELYTKGENGKQYGFTAIATRLNELGLKSATGISWSRSSVRAVITNPIYVGKIRWNRRRKVKKMVDGVIKIEHPVSKIEDMIIVEGKHEAIIPIETFELAQYILKNNTVNPNPDGLETKNPLAGLVECMNCGRKLVRIYHKGKRQSDTLMCPTYRCNTMSIYMQTLETIIIEMLKSWLSDYKVKAVAKDINVTTKILDKSLRDIDIEIESTQKQYNKTYDLLEQGIYDTETFMERTKLLQEAINDYKKNKANMEEQISQIEIQNNARTEIIPKINNIINTYNSLLSPIEKNNLLKQVLAKGFCVIYTLFE